jgi:hypothetical protein
VAAAPAETAPGPKARDGVFVSGDNKGAWHDLAGVAGLVEEGPEVAGLILVVEVSGDVDAVHHGRPLLLRRTAVIWPDAPSLHWLTMQLLEHELGAGAVTAYGFVLALSLAPDPNVISAVFRAKRRELPLACLVSGLLSVRGAGSGRAKEGQHCEHTAVVLG